LETSVEKVIDSVRALLSGDVSLKYTFWVYGFAGVLAFKWPMRTIEKYGYDGTLIYLGLSAMAIAYFAFVVIAVWRSASRYSGNKGWAYTARVAVILWPLSIFWGP
jgi:hypothetical protein